MVTCPQCNALLPATTPDRCPACGAPRTALPPGPAGPSPGAPPWERPGQGPWPRRIYDTTVLVLLSPGPFFRSLPPAGVGAALGYAAILGGATMLVSLLTSFLWQALLPIAIDGGPPRGLEVVAAWVQGAGLVGALVIQLLVFLARLFVWSAVTHGALLLMGGVRHPYDMTLRVFCYAQAALVFDLLPVCGVVIALVGVLALAIVGISEAQGVDGFQATLAVLIPLVACCCCCGAGLLSALSALGALVAPVMGEAVP